MPCESDAAHEQALPAIVCEVEFLRDASEDELEMAAQQALSTQALPKRYAHGLTGEGAMLWSVAFDNHKHVAAARV